jgi:hypothetical protein
VPAFTGDREYPGCRFQLFPLCAGIGQQLPMIET